MATLQELTREKQRLVNYKSSKDDIVKIGKQRRKLKREISDLKSPLKASIRRGVRKTGRITSSILKRGGKTTSVIVKNYLGVKPKRRRRRRL